MFILRKIKKWLILIVILALLGFGIYKFFINCEHINTLLDHEFTLEKMDYATVVDNDKKITVKLIKTIDNRCKEDEQDSCTKTNELLAKLLVLNGSHMSYIELGEITNKVEGIKKKKMTYNIELISITEDGKVTIKVTK